MRIYVSQLHSPLLQLKADPNLNQAKTLFNTYVTGFGAAIVAYAVLS